MNTSGGSKLATYMVLFILACVVLQGLLAQIAAILPWLFIGLAAIFGIIVTVRVFISRSKNL